MSFPSLTDIHDILFNEDACIRFLIENELLYTAGRCPVCNDFVKMESKRYRCRKKSCRHSWSIFRGSFFGLNRLKCNEVMLICYLLLSKASTNTILMLTKHCRQTIADYKGHFLQLIGTSLNEEDTLIGGNGMIVEIDETKIGKRKYHRGHRVDGCWVLVGVEHSDQRKVFVKAVPDRSASTIVNTILNHVRAGSVIRTDLWRGYSGLENYSFIHETVNHSQHFKNPLTGIHTNTVEGTNNGIKMTIPVRNRNADSIEGHLALFVWRRKHHKNLWQGFIDTLKDASYDY